jgi:large conductance mechanosensitive channel
MQMVRRIRDLAQSDLIAVAGAFLIGLAAFELVRAAAEHLIMPVVVLLFGESEFPFLSFAVDNTEFAYGFVISAAIAFLLACAVVFPLWRSRRADDEDPGTRDCPECLTPIPAAAKRCPECTAVLAPDAA